MRGRWKQRKTMKKKCEESAKYGMCTSAWNVLPQTPQYRSLEVVRDTIQGHKVISLHNNIRFKVDHIWNCRNISESHNMPLNVFTCAYLLHQAVFPLQNNQYDSFHSEL